MKRPLLTACLALTALTNLAQSPKFTFKIGSAYELPSSAVDLSFFSDKKDGIVNISLSKNQLNVLRFDPGTLEKTAQTEIDIPEMTFNSNAELTLNIGGHHYWLRSDWNPELQKEYLMYNKLNIKTGEFIEKDIKMLEVGKIAGTSLTGVFARKTRGKYRFDASADDKRLLVSYRVFPKEKSDKKNFDVFGFHVYDEQLKKLWSVEYTMPTLERMTDLMDCSVDSKGNAYMLTKVFDTEKRLYQDSKTKKPAYHYEILRFIKDAKAPQVTKISLGDNYISEANILERKDHEMQITCTYRVNPDPAGTNGVFVATLDELGSLKINGSGLHAFSKEELLKFESPKAKRKIEKDDDYVPPVVKLRNVFPCEDGGVFIVCEEYLMDRKERKDYDHTFYYYEDIYCIKIGKNGNTEWFRKVPKKQVGTDAFETLGIKFIADKNSFNFLYIDNIKNLDLAEDEEPKMHVNRYGGQVLLASLDLNGNLTRKILFDQREERMMILPAYFTSMGDNRFLGRALLFKGGFKPIVIASE